MKRVSPRAGSTAGWEAKLSLHFERRESRTVLASRSHFGPLTVQRPFHPDGRTCHAYMLHPPGGVVGGDSLNVRVNCAEGADALITTPGASKFYRSAGPFARQAQRLSAATGASLTWVPQENIHYSGARVSMDTQVDLVGDARVTLWDIHCFGRLASRAPFERGLVDATLTIARDGCLLLHERQRTTPNTLSSPAFLAGLSVSGTMIISGSQPDAVRRCALDVSNAVCGGTQIDDLLVLRYLGHSSEQAKQLFTDAWRAVAQSQGTELGELPRIWKT